MTTSTRNCLRLFASVFACGVLLAPMMLGAAEPPRAQPATSAVLLRILPGREPWPTYEISTRSATETASTSRTERHLFTSKKRLTVQTLYKDAGRVHQMAWDLGGTFQVDGKTLLSSGAAPSQTQTVLTTLGVPVGRDGSQAPAEAGALVLPPQPIGPGQSWEIHGKLPGSAGLEATTRYTLKEVRVIQGRRCAILTSTAKLDRELASKRMTLKFECVGSTVFDLDLGRVVQSTSSTEMRTKYLAANKANLAYTSSKTRRSVRLLGSP